jgi:crossover junction endodeoxyribonuclease RuvC
MQERLAKPARKAAPLQPETAPRGNCRHEIILGIDPSLRGTGYGIIRVKKPHAEALAFGTIHSPPAWPRSRCLVNTAQVLKDQIQKHHPTVCAIEGLFFAQNLQTALLMGEARGVCLLSAAEAGLDIFEIAARKVKQAMVGFGAAQKLAVAKMVQRLLNLAEAPAADAADALALALTFAQESRSYSLTPLKML